MKGHGLNVGMSRGAWSSTRKRMEYRPTLKSGHSSFPAYCAPVLSLLCQGRSNRQIAGLLFLQEKTVKNYASELFRFFGVTSRIMLMIKATNAGFVPCACGHSQVMIPKRKQRPERWTVTRSTEVKFHFLGTGSGQCSVG